jgi:hypothetical protein
MKNQPAAIPPQRMVDKQKRPDTESLASWLGKSAFGRWNRVVHYIEDSYPGVFAPEWLYGGQKHGWCYRFKKSKSFCTLIPARNRLLVQVVFGKEERTRADSLVGSLSPAGASAYAHAPTFHDGTWMLLPVLRDSDIRDIRLLLSAKRRPARSLSTISERSGRERKHA